MSYIHDIGIEGGHFQAGNIPEEDGDSFKISGSVIKTEIEETCEEKRNTNFRFMTDYINNQSCLLDDKDHYLKIDDEVKCTESEASGPVLRNSERIVEDRVLCRKKYYRLHSSRFVLTYITLPRKLILSHHQPLKVKTHQYTILSINA